MVGEAYWFTGVMLHYYDGKWGATIEFLDNGFCDQESTEGEVRTRYACDTMQAAIDLVLADAKRLGITEARVDGPVIYVKGDGEDASVPLPPDWRALVNAECARRGWRSAYSRGNS